MKVFITGVFRSGTTLILQILNVNQNISITYDTVQFMRFCYKKYGLPHVKKDDASKMIDDINDRLKKRNQKEFDSKKIKENIGVQKGYVSYGFLYNEIMKTYVNNENWGDRTTLEWRSSIDLLKMFDDMHIIHVIRDPRDLITSWKPHTFAPGNDYLDAIANCYDSMKIAIKNKEKNHHRYHILKFEDVVTDPENQIKLLCTHLGLEFDKKMIDIRNFKSKMGGRWNPNKHSSFKDKIDTISTKPVGRWKEKLSKNDLILVELAMMDMMDKYNYKLSDMKYNVVDVKNAFIHLFKSKISTNSLLNVLENKEGVQRYSLDPLDEANWGKISQ